MKTDCLFNIKNTTLSNITSYENYTYDGEGREISSEHSGIYTNTTYGSDGSVTQTVLTSPYGTTIENR